MSELSAASVVAPNFITMAQNDPISAAASLEQLLENFGSDDVANAGGQEFMQAFGNSLKEIIANADLPEAVKNMAYATIDQHVSDAAMSMPCSAECQVAVAASEVGGEMSHCGTVAAEQVEAAASSGADGADSAMTAEQHEAEQERLENEQPVVVAGGEPAGGGAGSNALAETTANAGKVNGDEDEDGVSSAGGGGNWLTALAGKMAEIQAKFLDSAIAASNVMAAEADAAAAGGEGQSGDFLKAQAKYTSNMQLFSMFSQQVSTSIKTIGEALNAISRKQ